MKYIFVLGANISGLGKGNIASSIAHILKKSEKKVTIIKIDPYLNTDAGNMAPYEHGEVFVTDDGGQVDMDIGNYERFLDENLSKNNNITSGKIYKSIIEKECNQGFLGQTVQMVPHVSEEIQNQIKSVSEGFDYCVIELGGTIGDMETLPFIEALRNLENFFTILLTLVPEIWNGGEQKTRLSQAGIKELRSLGLNPDLIIPRSATP